MTKDSTLEAVPPILVDADACPVKEEIFRVAERHGVAVAVVSNSFLRLPQLPSFVRSSSTPAPMSLTTG